MKTINNKNLFIFTAIFTTMLSASFSASANIDIATKVLTESVGESDYEVLTVKESLLGKHYYFRQKLNSITVEDADFIVSIDSKGEVYNKQDSFVATNAKSKSVLPVVNTITTDSAYDIAWQELRVHGELVEKASIEKAYKSIDGQLKLVFNIGLSVKAPFGYWNIAVDANSGEVYSTENRAISRKHVEHKTNLKAYKGKLLDRRAEFSRLNALEAQKSTLKSFNFEVGGQATIFDPNPVTTLGRTDLQDTTDAREFSNAYVTVDLKQVTLKRGVYHLSGPFVELADFESPRATPITSTDGNWLYERGEAGFNDAMTFYHVDQTQRYIQSLGFTGRKGFLNFPVKVDANGLNGADNSHFIPGSNKIAFGHGCVDDNEDTDVILHEYGHAIQHNITPSWRGGDTGAMGEGFGDYWAASFSTSRPGGMDNNPSWVFKWDGHNNCWGGRVLNATNLKYVHTKTYRAHARLSGGVTDELWSTPLFQAFLELRKMGYKRSDMDKIVLESHFGMGSGLKMRDLAKQTVLVAKKLFPNGPHSRIYLEKFKAQNIIQ